MQTALTKLKIRAIKIILILELGSFPEGGVNTKTIYGASLPGYLHIEANVQRMPGLFNNSLVAVIYGMTTEDCIAATKFNPLQVQYYNQVQFYAGYIDVAPQPDGTYDQAQVTAAMDQLPIYYQGEILVAAPDFNDPNRPFVIQSTLACQSLVTLLPPTNSHSPQNFSAVVQSMISSYNSSGQQIQYSLQFTTLDTTVNNANYSGSFLQQLQQMCNDYNYQYRITFSATSPNNQQIEITNLGITSGAVSQVLNADNGMIGYPVVLPMGVGVKEFFNPNRSINDSINLETYLTPLSSAVAGVYSPWSITSILQTNGDAWESMLTLYTIQNTGTI